MDQTIGDTLALVNIARRAFGKEELTELPDARPGDSQDCLYFRALSDMGCTGVSGPGISFSSERVARTVAALWGTEAQGTQLSTPKNVRDVIKAFDNVRTVPHYNV